MEIINEVEEKMLSAIDHLANDFNKVHTGRANPSMLDGVEVSAYGSNVPLNQVAMISVPEARQLLVKPFDPNTIKDLEKAITEANLGFNPDNDGEMLRINIPQLTEEKRKSFVKDVKKYGEDAKIAIRNARKDANNKVKKTDDLSNDEKKIAEDNIQELTTKYNKEIEEKVEQKEKEVMTV